MSFTHEEIDFMLQAMRRKWSCAIRLQITAGYGCTVLEIFALDAPRPSVPMQRIFL